MVNNPDIMSLTAMFFSMITFAVYFAIAYMLGYIIGWGIIQVLRPIFKILSYGRTY